MRLVLGATLMVVFLGTCVSQRPRGRGINPDDFRAGLAENRAKWEASGIESYVMEERRSCFCLKEAIGPFDVTVIRNNITETKFSNSSQLTGTPQNPSVFTVEEAFQVIEDTLRSSPPVAALTVEYDPMYGYITNFFIDSDERIADEESGVTFKLLDVISRGPDRPGPDTPRPPSRRTRPKKIRSKLKLRLNRTKWKARRPKVYTFRLQRLCFCPPEFVGPFLVTVTKSNITDVVFEGVGPPTQAPSDIPTMRGLFEIIAKALDGPRKAFKVHVDYDRFFGVPKNITIDRIEFAVDDEITYIVELVSGFGRKKRG